MGFHQTHLTPASRNWHTSARHQVPPHKALRPACCLRAHEPICEVRPYFKTRTPDHGTDLPGAVVHHGFVSDGPSQMSCPGQLITCNHECPVGNHVCRSTHNSLHCPKTERERAAAWVPGFQRHCYQLRWLMECLVKRLFPKPTRPHEGTSATSQTKSYPRGSYTCTVPSPQRVFKQRLPARRTALSWIVSTPQRSLNL